MQRKSTFTTPAIGILASSLALIGALAWSGTSRAETSKSAQSSLARRFTSTVRPFLQTYCVTCHGRNGPQAQLDLTVFPTVASVVRDYPHWSLVLQKLSAGQMPPKGAGSQPSPRDRDAVIQWIRDVWQQEEQRSAGDPGPVLAHRLSNAEYNYTVRDLTGIDSHPTREFPVDPANQEGFDNSGESLTLSSGLVKKYVQAARTIGDSLVLTNTGLEFASHPVLAETDRDKFCILRIVDFYRRQPTDYADYLLAAWRYRHRAALGIPAATIPSVAAQAKVSPRYLQTVWNVLTTPDLPEGPIGRLQARWNALPAPDSKHTDAPRAQCEAVRDWLLALRKKLAWHFSNLHVPAGFSEGGQCFVLWKDRQYASHRRLLNPDALQVNGVPASHLIPARKKGEVVLPEHTVTDPVDPEVAVPADETARARLTAACSRFCSVFPDAFYVAERGRMFMDDPGDQGRLLTAGLHNSMGYFRDDSPLMELILDEQGRRTLNNLWLDFDTVAAVPERMHLEFFVYERAEAGTINDPEFNFVRPEDKDATSDAKIKRLADLYLAKARRNGGQPLALQAIGDHFKWVSAHIRATERARVAAQPLHLDAMLGFASRAWRRPLSQQERGNLLAFYRSLRQSEGLSHEDAVRDTVVSILMSPKFLFRMDLEAAGAPPAEPADHKVLNGHRTVAVGLNGAEVPRADVQPLSDYALASRLSYFLWSSMPDRPLLALAAAGTLHRPEVLDAQARRMLRDPRARALAVEFGGNWLDYRHFPEFNSVDRNRFPAFTNDLREAMYEEPVHFFTDQFQPNRSVLDMLYGKYTFVNSALAGHYGMTGIKPAGSGWVRADNADRYGRGGLLPMAVFLTNNSPGLRTSPVKRGYWVVRRLLGQYIPPPPPNVPALPADESKMGTVTLREALAQHRANPACAGCHARFDSYGLVFEGYGPIGERRSVDLGGKPVDSRAPFPGGTERSGVSGLQSFVRQQRQNDFLDTLSRKLLSYGLGRTLQPSDNPTLRAMRQRLVAGGYHFDSLVSSIVTSRQFRYRRASTALARN